VISERHGNSRGRDVCDSRYIFDRCPSLRHSLTSRFALTLKQPIKSEMVCQQNLFVQLAQLQQLG
jgi:hypothetical protein